MRLYGYLYVIALFLFVSCTELYEPEISKPHPAIVVEGYLHDEHNPSLIRLSSAHVFSYNPNLLKQPVSGAQIELVENESKLWEYSETEAGQYEPRDIGFKPIPGNTYRLNVYTADGYHIESQQEYLPASSELDTLYIKPQKKEVYKYDKSGSRYSEIQWGAEIYAAEEEFSTESSLRYIKYEYNPIEKFIVGCRRTRPEYKRYLFDGWISLNKASADGNHHEVNFFVSNSVPDSWGETCPRRTGYVIPLTRKFLSQGTYDFWLSGQTQTQNGEDIYGARPTNLLSNLRCVNDSSIAVLGCFEVYSVKNDLFYFYFHENEIVSTMSHVIRNVKIENNGKLIDEPVIDGHPVWYHPQTFRNYLNDQTY